MRLARELGGEIVGVDSMQVYRGMDIGTAKPDAETRAAVPHHLIDLADPAQDYSVAQFQTAGRAVLGRLAERSVAAVITGGTGLHFRALVDPLEFPPTDLELRSVLEQEDPVLLVGRLLAVDPRAGDHLDLANPRRVLRAIEIYRLTGRTPSMRAIDPAAVAVAAYRPLIPFVGLGIDPGAGRCSRIVRRFDVMLERGLVDEVRSLSPHMGRAARQAVGYKELLPVLAGDVSLADGRQAAISATAALAKRQRTFFGRDPRIAWLDPTLDGDALFSAALTMIESSGQGR